MKIIASCSPSLKCMGAFLPQRSALHPLGEHAAVLGVQVGGGVADRLPVERRGGHPVGVRRRRAPKEGPKTTATWQHGRGPDTPRKPCHLGGETERHRERHRHREKHRESDRRARERDRDIKAFHTKESCLPDIRHGYL